MTGRGSCRHGWLRGCGLSSVRAIAPEAHPAPDRAPDWVAGGTPEPLRSQLTAALGADRVLTRATDLVMYASDASPYRLIPQAVAMPRDVDDVVKLLAFARERGVPLVFRAGGTSLNGQAQTDSVMVDVRRHWQRARVLEDGAAVRVKPGIVVGQVNRLLARHGRKLGPDPASSDIACVGGVIANNSGGMRCGVVADSYRTVRSLKLVLANGAVIDTAEAGAEQQFAAAAPELARGLVEIRDELRADRELAERVARKFEIKNTMGYRLCAFLDADEPLEIFRRLVIGSEGTLAFVAEAVFETVPFGSHASVALVFFRDLDGRGERGRRPGLVRRERDRADDRPDADRRRVQHAGHAGALEDAAARGGRAADRVPRRRGRRARRTRAPCARVPRGPRARRRAAVLARSR